MKNKIEFQENQTIQTSSGSLFDKKQNDKSFKIKGKTKIYSNNNEMIFTDNDWLDIRTEWKIVSKRMLLFLKFIFLSLIVISLLILFKKNLL